MTTLHVATENPVRAEGHASDLAGPPVPRRRHRFSAWPYLYVLPALTLTVVFVVVPLVETAWYSLHAWDGLSAAKWAGVRNYTDAFTDPVIQESLLHAVILIVYFAALPVAVGLLFAALLSRQNLRGAGFFRVVLFLPQVVTLVVTGVAWKWMLAPDGTVNQLLRGVGLGDITRAWFGDFDWSLPSVGVVGMWVVFGFCMILFLAGISKIDTSLYDAAKVDGAGPVREFFTVTLPGLKPEIGIALSITMISGLRSFDVVYVTTGGGPGHATNVPALEMYQQAFVNGTVGSASAVAVILTVLILFVTGLLRLAFKDRS